jgi:hypothetical protein
MKATLLLTFLILTGRVLAIEDTPENRLRQAQRYLETTPPKEMFADMAEQAAKNAPPAQRDIIRVAFTKDLDIDYLTKAMAAAMVKHFTADELSALADFYGSAVGKSAMKKFGAYMAELMPAIQGEVLKLQAKINRQLPDVQK